CIDTITDESGIALVHPGKTIGFEPLESRHSSDGLFFAIDRLFKAAGIKPSDLDGVVVMKGPGSFTSVRVGVAVANPFAHQLNIPIAGLTTDEFYAHKTEDPDFLYLQTMNREEVYTVGFGKYQSKIKTPILPLADLPEGKGIPWLGQLSPEHQAALPEGYKAITNPKNTQDTWASVCDSVFKSKKAQKAYELVEPYYAKEAKITPSKRRLIIGKIQ
ncbi:tRNA (adenosine(37)-N6)-threonylcarbamoyltransferase complex dimerization subunit type 1 TsaB, partial [Candidatus Peregrinibacteria bacterium]|nr:tRNA (adenosine(37)-N6)-threonylcarbamoyltransferase complex dimerization subunit type 1 TsaB [Candidatus Peregrinibacteria bacterium]